MIVPCIDLMNGKAVQLEQGERLKVEWPIQDALTKFEGFPILHAIDLDAAKRQGRNLDAIQTIVQTRPTRVGGGVRLVEDARALIDMGAEQVILGSAIVTSEGVNFPLLESMARAIGTERIILAVDSKQGKVAVAGWRELLSLDLPDILKETEEKCAGWLCTHVDREGLLQGADLDFFLNLRTQVQGTLIAAGGVTTLEEARTLSDAGLEVAIGMALYTGRIDVDKARNLIIQNGGDGAS